MSQGTIKASDPVRARNLAVAIFVLAAASAATPSPAAEGADWPEYRGPGRSGHSSETGLLRAWPEEGPRVAWRLPLGDGFSGMSVAAGRLYTMFGRGKDELVLCVDAASGKEIWTHRLDEHRFDNQGGGPRSTPTVSGGAVFVAGARGKLAALDAATGKLRWSHDLAAEFGAAMPRWGVSASPLVEGDLLLMEVGGKENHAVMAFNKESGEVAWNTHTDRPGYSSPVAADLAGVHQILFFTGSHLISVLPGTGELYWRLPWKTSYDVNAALPVVVAPDSVFISSSYDTGAALFRVKVEGGRAEVEEVWRSRVMKNHFNTSILHDGHIYGFDDATLKCIEAASGTEKWAQRGFAKGSLLLADGHLVILGEKGQLALAEATSAAYREKSRVQILQGKTWTMPTLSHGRLYIRNEAELLALDVAGVSE